MENLQNISRIQGEVARSFLDQRLQYLESDLDIPMRSEILALFMVEGQDPVATLLDRNDQRDIRLTLSAPSKHH